MSTFFPISPEVKQRIEYQECVWQKGPYVDIKSWNKCQYYLDNFTSTGWRIVGIETGRYDCDCIHLVKD